MLRFKILIFGAVYLLPFSAFPQALTHIWSQRFGDTEGESGESVAFDSSGNVVLTGGFRGTLNFGGSPLTSAGLDDIFLAKLDGNGTHIWSQGFGDTEWQGGWSVASDPSGNVVITGYFYGTVDFGGDTLTSAGGSDIFLAKFDANGTHLWSQRFGDTNSFQEGYSIAFDSSGNVVLTGTFRGTVDFGGGLLTSAGSDDIFLAKFDGNGTHLWIGRASCRERVWLLV
jgi:uncharacterized protein (AIM24 family)